MKLTSSDTEYLQYCFENRNDSCYETPWSPRLHIALYIVLGLLMTLTVGGNLMVIVSIIYFKQLHTPTNFLIASLACADFGVGLTVLPFTAVRSVESCWYFGKIFCRLHSYLDLSFCLASLFHLFFICVDRYVAVTDPLIYPVKFTVLVSGVFIAIAWIFSLVYSVFAVYMEDNEEELQEIANDLPCAGSCQDIFNKTWAIVSCLLFFTVLFTMVALYSKIFAVARRQARMIEIMSNKTQSLDNYSYRVRKREWKAAKTLGIAVITYLVLWSPYFIILLNYIFVNFITPNFVYEIMVWFSYSNSAMHPFIYSLFYPWFRNAMKMIVSCKIFHLDCSEMSLFFE